MIANSPELQSIIRYCVSAAARCPKGRRPVVCFMCDPPSVKFIEKGIEVEDPYICEVCQARALKKIKRDTNPMFGRMKHGDTIRQES